MSHSRTDAADALETNRPWLPFEKSLAGKRVLVTGHTGFTGSWLCLWLNVLGCDVRGFSLAPNTTPSLYDVAKINGDVGSTLGDLRDMNAVYEAVKKADAEIIFHLGAQPLVSRSFDDPIESYAVNALGTAHVLEAARQTASTKAIVCITTDKVYDDKDWEWGYRETDALGGKDPYSASKACAELIVSSYRRTMMGRGNGALVGIARGGNIIGGGDWAENRIVPDFVRALNTGAALVIRHPEAVRPWQHVMALVHGYLVLGAKLLEGDTSCAQSYNFGPSTNEAKSVGDLLTGLIEHWRDPGVNLATSGFPETRFLHVDSSLARRTLKWVPPIGFEETVKLTAHWYKAFYENPDDARGVTLRQIEDYRAGLRANLTT
jgi:CDP-glucose 4,6-dehydratase